MTIDKVIESGKKIDIEGITIFDVLSDWYIIVAVLAIALAFYFFIQSESVSVSGDGAVHFVMGFLVIIVFLAGTFFYGISELIKAREKAEEDYAIWVEDKVEPFLESLPQQKNAISYIKLNNDTPNNKQQLLVGYNNKGKLKVIKTNLEVTMDLDSGEEPYFTYVTLKKSLGEGYKKGLRIVEIHLPTDYKFTEIQ